MGTSQRVLAKPLVVESATDYVTGWLEQPNVDILEPGGRHLDIAFNLLRQQGTAGNLTTDVQLASLAIEHGGTVYSNDADFGRFDGPRWVNPLHGTWFKLVFTSSSSTRSLRRDGDVQALHWRCNRPVGDASPGPESSRPAEPS